MVNMTAGISTGIFMMKVPDMNISKMCTSSVNSDYTGIGSVQVGGASDTEL
jgi:hypothetical protein